MILLSVLLLAQSISFPQPKPHAPKQAKAPQEAKIAANPAPSMAPALPPPSMLSEKATILIQAKARADDLVQAFEAFKKEKPTYRIAARLSNGGSLSDILELSAMTNGTLFIVKISTTTGPKTQILSVDDIVDFYFP